jgi:transcriptional regulator
MYNLPEYKTSNKQEVIDFMKQNPFVTLTGCDAMNMPVATHVPVLLDEKDGLIILLGHMMKQTDHHKAFAKNENVLAIFNGPHAHVSASWYANPRQGSTWNYMTVHAQGKMKFLNDDGLLKVLTRTTAYFENNPASPALVEKMPAEYVERLMKAIVAFEIEVTSLEHVFKLSQTRDKESYNNIIDKLSAGDSNGQAVANEMRKRSKDLTT